MATVMSDRLSGVAAASFTNDGIYTNFLGTAPTYITDARYGSGLQFPAATQSEISEALSGTTTLRTFDRVYLISATPSASCGVMDVRDGGGVAICKALITAANGKLQLQNAAGTLLTGGASAATVPIGTRFRISYTMNGTSWSAIIYNNDTDNTIQESVVPSGTITSTTAASVREGFITAGGMGAAVTFNTYWPQDSDQTGDTGVRSLWLPSSPRHRSFSVFYRRSAPRLPVPAQVVLPNPTMEFFAIPRRARGMLRRRPVSAMAPPPQQNPPIRFFVVTRRPRGWMRKHPVVSVPIPAQTSPPIPAARTPRRPAFPKRRRVPAIHIPAQSHPVIPARRVPRRPPRRQLRVHQQPQPFGFTALPPATVRQAVGRKVRWITARLKRTSPQYWPQAIPVIPPVFEWEGEWIVGIVDREWIVGNPDIDPSGPR